MNWSTTYGCTASSQICAAGYVCSGGGTTGTCINTDSTPPTMSVTPASGTSGTSIAYTAYWQDTGSGLNGACYFILDGAWNATYCSGTGLKTYSGSLAQVGNHSVQLYAADVVGNAAYSSVYYYTVDTTAPTMSVTPASGTSGTSIAYTAYWQDTGSGLNGACYFSLDGAWHWYSTACSGTGLKTYSGSLTTVGSYSVMLYAADVVGNAAYSSVYYYDVVNPVCNPASVSNGTVAAYPSCAITCNSGYTLSGTTCVANTPTVTLKANGVAVSTTATYNTAATLTWTSTNATSCTGTGFSTGGALNNSSPGVSTGTLYGTQTYSISCTGAGGTANSSVVVHVLPVYGICSGSSCTLNTGIEGQTYTNLCSANCTSASYCGGSGGGGATGPSWHSVCANNACVVVNGAGTNQCSDNFGCAGSSYPSEYYGVCAQGACVMVSGTDAYCATKGVSSCSNYGGTCPNPTGSSYNINSSNDLKLSITKQAGTVTSNNTTLIIVEPLSGFSDTVNLSVNDWGGLAAYSPTANFSRTSLTSTQYSSGATFSVSVPVTVPSNNYFIVVRGTGAASGKVIDRTIKVILHNANDATWQER